MASTDASGYQGWARVAGRWENSHVRPSSLAWKALVQIAVERGTPLADERASVSPE